MTDYSQDNTCSTYITIPRTKKLNHPKIVKVIGAIPLPVIEIIARIEIILLNIWTWIIIFPKDNVSIHQITRK